MRWFSISLAFSILLVSHPEEMHILELSLLCLLLGLSLSLLFLLLLLLSLLLIFLLHLLHHFLHSICLSFIFSLKLSLKLILHIDGCISICSLLFIIFSCSPKVCKGVVLNKFLSFLKIKLEITYVDF